MKSIATRMGIDATYFSQLIHRMTSPTRIVEIVRALNEIDESGMPPVEPWHFDEYVTLSAGEALKNDPDLIDIFRTVLYRMSESERETWKRVTAALAPRR